jgi:hypothetical protein
MARAAERRVPTPRVLLTWGPEDGHHVLQEAMWHHRAELAAHGVHYPGGFPEAHFQAAVDLQGVDFNDWHDEEAEGAWARMAEQVRGPEEPPLHELRGVRGGDLPGQRRRRLVRHEFWRRQDVPKPHAVGREACRWTRCN